MQLSDLVRRNLIFPAQSGADAPAVLRAFAEHLAQAGLVPDAGELYAKLREREELGSTGIGLGVAIPHCKLPGLKEVLLAVGTLKESIDFGAVDGQPVRLFFVLASPEASPAKHLKSLAAISKWVKANRHVETILTMTDPERVYDFLIQGEAPKESQKPPA